MVTPKKGHNIELNHLSGHVLEVLRRLHHCGHQAYLVGGSVRDLLLGNTPKDFDVATDACPETVKKIFGRHCRLIGRRFRLAHVFYGHHVVEVATFRGAHPHHEEHPGSHRSKEGLLVRDNVYGSLHEDAWRRDFSVNALYYDFSTQSVVDYTSGMADLKEGVIRLLGDPESRFREDPVRILRAIRFAAKLDFTLDEQTEKPIPAVKHLLTHVPGARLFEEILKLFYCGHASRAFQLSQRYGLFGVLFPELDIVLSNSSNKEFFHNLIENSCENTDRRLREGASLNPAFLFAVLLWPVLSAKMHRYLKRKMKSYLAFERSVNEVIKEQLKTIAIPKRHTNVVREIWSIQRIMQKEGNRYTKWVVAQPRFRAAYDFLLLRSETGETNLNSAVKKWGEFHREKTSHHAS